VNTSISIQKLPNDFAINDFATKTRQDESGMIGSGLSGEGPTGRVGEHRTFNIERRTSKWRTRNHVDCCDSSPLCFRYDGPARPGSPAAARAGGVAAGSGWLSAAIPPEHRSTAPPPPAQTLPPPLSRTLSGTLSNRSASPTPFRQVPARYLGPLDLPRLGPEGWTCLRADLSAGAPRSGRRRKARLIPAQANGLGTGS
jgi:hypothetical protein